MIYVVFINGFQSLGKPQFFLKFRDIIRPLGENIILFNYFSFKFFFPGNMKIIFILL